MDGAKRIERRRTPRRPARADVRCRIEVRARVRVVDISASGALLATDTVPPVGSPAQVKTGLGTDTFASDIEIRRRAKASDWGVVGVAFTSMDERNRRSLDHFLKKASN
jgi:hypothetical protein